MGDVYRDGGFMHQGNFVFASELLEGAKRDASEGAQKPMALYKCATESLSSIARALS